MGEDHGVEVVEATPQEAANVAASYLERAARELRAGDFTHADVWIDSALCWLPASTHPR